MTRDPEIATHDFLVENVDTHERLDSSVGPPREPRWGGKKLPETPRRACAVEEKKRWQARRAELGEIAETLPAIASFPLVSAYELAQVIGFPSRVVDARLLELAMDVLGRNAIMALCGIGACAVPVDELAAALYVKPRTMRRALAWLVEQRLLEAVPTFERHGAASSRRATAYVITPWVLQAIGGCSVGSRVACRKMSWHPERILPAGESSRELSPSISDLNAQHLAGGSSLAPLAAGVVSPSGTVDCPSAVPDAAPDELGPGTRQGESTGASLTAPDASGVELVRSVADALRELDNPFARELAAESERRAARLAAYGKSRGAS